MQRMLVLLLSLLACVKAENMFGCKGTCENDTTCTVSWDNECDEQHYKNDTPVIICFIVAVVCLVFMLGWCCIAPIYMCCCKNDNKPSPGICGLMGAKGQYCMLCLVILCVALSVILGVVSTGKASTARDDLFDAAEGQINQLFTPRLVHEDAVLFVAGEYIKNPKSGESTEFIVTNTRSAHTTAKEEVTDKRKDANDVELWPLYIFTSLVAVLLVCLCCCSFKSCSGCPAAVFSAIFFFLAFISWLFTTGFTVLALAGNDLCSEVSALSLNETSVVPGLVRHAVDKQCPEIAGTESRIRQQGTVAAQTVCEVLMESCASGSAYDAMKPDEVFSCPADVVNLCNSGNVAWRWPDLPVTASSLPETSEILAYAILPGVPGRCPATSCTISECAESCLNSSSAHAASTSMSENLNYGTKLTDVLVTDVLYLLDCSSTRTAVSGISGTCGDAEDVLKLLLGSSVLASVAILLMALSLTCTTCRGKRVVENPEETVPATKNEPISDHVV
eukprot:TRINITY_DN13462_c0_g1_i1.p1 TRINITY_DN13462_c0_g1~~TRINITY_DN13462_c0_g1_i1.p1  ORF type:complete len:522 (+),score=52.85 TRINITY_DN13462_c0_g1_i1:53-1567(+)